MVRKLLLLLTINLLFTLGCSSKPKTWVSTKNSPVQSPCYSSREFITTVEYLRQRQQELALTEKQIRNIADTVSQGCSRAAQRFARAFDVMTRAQVASNSGLQLALQLSKLPDEYTHAFLEIFKLSFLKQNLDLDLHTSLKIAVSLSTDYAGKPHHAHKDFLKLTKFCTQNQSTQLPLNTCARLARRIVKHNENYSEEIADAFIKVFTFAKDQQSLNLNTRDALKLAQQVSRHSAQAADNFIAAYSYGTSEKGLGLQAQQALKFSKVLVERTLPAPQRSVASEKKKQ